MGTNKIMLWVTLWCTIIPSREVGSLCPYSGQYTESCHPSFWGSFCKQTTSVDACLCKGWLGDYLDFPSENSRVCGLGCSMHVSCCLVRQDTSRLQAISYFSSKLVGWQCTRASSEAARFKKRGRLSEKKKWDAAPKASPTTQSFLGESYSSFSAF